MPKINETISSPNQSTRGGHTPQLTVYHIADGTYAGTKAWFAQAQAETSSHFIIAQDGRICQCVPLDKMAWCNGTTALATDNRYYGHSTVELVRKLGGNANQYSVSIEFEGFYAVTCGALTEAQLEAAVWLTGYIRDEVKRMYNFAIPFDRAHLVGHNEITPKTRPNCPGQKFPWGALLARLTDKPAGSLLYRVQIGAFSVKANADTFLKGTVLPKGVNAFCKLCPDDLYRVQVGAFGVKANATNYLAEVRGKGLEAFVVAEEG